MQGGISRDCRGAIDHLASSDDVDLRKFANAARLLFCGGDPPCNVDIEDVAASVRAFFPTAFARKFDAWNRSARAAFKNGRMDDHEVFGSLFLSSFNSIWNCWVRVVHFVPFVFLAPLARLTDEIHRKGGTKLARAFLAYDTYYRVGDDEKENARERYEGRQSELLALLIELCADLGASPPLPTPFFFKALLTGQETFRTVFPERFAADLAFLRAARNRIVHRNLESRRAEYLVSMHLLIEAAFLDLVSILVPLARAYGVYYVEATEETARTVAFSGLNTSPVRFNLQVSDTGRASIEMFVPQRIYLIDRRKELEREPASTPLEPEDYADLTPFIVERGQVDLSLSEAERKMYALDEYRASNKGQFISFSDLIEYTHKRLPKKDPPTDVEKLELKELLAQIERFSAVVERLDEFIRVRRSSGNDFFGIRQAAWKSTSKRHLESIVAVDSVSYDGRSMPVAADAGLCTYDPALYEPPRVAEDIASFFNSNKRGLLLVGGSGFGKTTLLASTFLQRLQAGDIAIFLSGRWLSKPTLKDILVDVTSTMGAAWTPVELDEFVRDENASRSREAEPSPPTQVTIFIDAINEYTAGLGASALLEEIIDFVKYEGSKQFGCKLKKIRLVATCRSETWDGYRQKPPVMPDPDAFYCAADGAPIAASGFDDEESRRRLYERYRTKYRLSRTPYAGLAPSVADLFCSPLILGLVAETYGTLEADAVGSEIPKDLNYYAVFSELRRRKLRDCRFLVRDQARRETIEVELDRCLTVFASRLYARMTSADDPRDYVGVEQTTRKPMSEFTSARSDRDIPAFRALREIGLITAKGVSETDDAQEARQGSAYVFFHDRYAEYELAGVYQSKTLRRLTAERNSDPAAIEELATTIERLVRLGTDFPVLSGAIEHWLLRNLRENKGAVSTLIPLCDRLSRSESGSVRNRNSEALTGFVVRRSVAAKDLYRAAFSAGGRTLRTDLATALAETWPGLAADVARDFIESCHPVRDELAIETFADVFAEAANGDRKDSGGSGPIAFVKEISPDLKGLVALVMDQNKLKSHLAFLIRFCQITIVTCAERPHVLRELQAFLIERFHLLTSFLVGRQTGNPLVDWPMKKLRDLLRERFENSVYAGWENAVSCDGINDTFYVEDDERPAVIQRDILLEYVEYLCMLHNGDLQWHALDSNSRFSQLTMMMLNFRRYSILGFAAYASLSIAIGDDHKALRRIALELASNGSEAGRFVSVNIVEAYSLIHPLYASEALAIARDEMLPHLVADIADLPHFIVCAAGIVETDVEQHWDAFVPILDVSFGYVAGRDDHEEMLRFGEELRCMTFFGNAEIGRKFVDYLLRSGFLEDGSAWRAATLEMCAGMLAGHRADLTNLFGRYNVADSTLTEVEELRDEAVLKQHREFGTRARWNVFFVRALANNAKLRYLLLKDLFCAMALCNSVDEWSKQMGTFMIEAIRAYTEDDDPQTYARLSVEDVYAATPWRPKQGGGVRYVPRRKKSAAARS